MDPTDPTLMYGLNATLTGVNATNEYNATISEIYDATPGAIFGTVNATAKVSECLDGAFSFGFSEAPAISVAHFRFNATLTGYNATLRETFVGLNHSNHSGLNVDVIAPIIEGGILMAFLLLLFCVSLIFRCSSAFRFFGHRGLRGTYSFDPEAVETRPRVNFGLYDIDELDETKERDEVEQPNGAELNAEKS